uniref:Uncharacterized protein n=1 Tax=Pararge aegeria TaxID=116150 RepID=S4NSF1_9NEOP
MPGRGLYKLYTIYKYLGVDMDEVARRSYAIGVEMEDWVHFTVRYVWLPLKVTEVRAAAVMLCGAGVQSHGRQVAEAF